MVRRALTAVVALVLVAGACSSGGGDQAAPPTTRAVDVESTDNRVSVDTGEFAVDVTLEPLQITVTDGRGEITRPAPFVVRNGTAAAASRASAVHPDDDGATLDVTFADGSSGTIDCPRARPTP